MLVIGTFLCIHMFPDSAASLYNHTYCKNSIIMKWEISTYKALVIDITVPCQFALSAAEVTTTMKVNASLAPLSRSICVYISTYYRRTINISNKQEWHQVTNKKNNIDNVILKSVSQCVNSLVYRRIYSWQNRFSFADINDN